MVGVNPVRKNPVRKGGRRGMVGKERLYLKNKLINSRGEAKSSPRKVTF